VEQLEKLVAKAGSTVQRNRLTFKVGNILFQNPWRKTPYSLFESCRGCLDLKLSYSKLNQLLFKFLEKNSLRQCTSEIRIGGDALRRNVAPAACRAGASVALGIRVAPLPRPHAGRGAPSPHARASRHLGVHPAARRRDRAVLAGCAPRTAGPTAALPPYARRPRASTTASISHRHPLVTRSGRAYKTNPFLLPRAPPPPPSHHCRRRSTPSSGRSLYNPSGRAP
jgi:hypothetical protein